MRRSARHHTSVTLSFPSPFNTCVNATEQYCQALNLKPLVLPVPFKSGVHDPDLVGFAIRLRRNRSFVKTDQNQKPEPFPEELQAIDLSNGERRIEQLVKSLSGEDVRPGILVMLIQPPLNTIGDDTHTEVLTNSRPLTGVLIRIGAPRNTDSPDDQDSPSSVDQSDRFERSITGSFCRRSVPLNVAEELLRVTLVRAIAEALCYEDVGLREFRRLSMPDKPPPPISNVVRHSDALNVERDKRFISMNTLDIGLCPTIFVSILSNELKFLRHWDKEEGPNEFIHENHKECPCIKKCRAASLAGINPGPDYYQFFTLNTKRMKGLIEQNLLKLIPQCPSTAAYDFCFKDQGLDRHRKRGADVENEKVELAPRKKRVLVS